jgi:DNA-binding NtrC family response regulator
MEPSILVVDDEATVRLILRRWLERSGYVVREANSAAGALAEMDKEPAAIMFSDIRMPGQDGLWLVEQVNQKWPATAIVMASGADDLHTVLNARKKGVVDYIPKPFGRELVMQALERAKAALEQIGRA